MGAGRSPLILGDLDPFLVSARAPARRAHPTLIGEEPVIIAAMTSVQLDAAQRADTLEAIGDLLRARYVFPDVVPAILDVLDAGHRTGRYEVDDPGAFAEVVGADLRGAGTDKHLGVRFDPAGNTALRNPARQDPGPDARARRQSIRIHHGLVAQRILDGNVRYLQITDFDWVPGETEAAHDAAARFLGDADAIVLDLRGNLGGEPAAVQYLVSHFLPEPALLMTFVKANRAAELSRSIANRPAGRLAGIPLFVLIDAHTYSAGEAFAYHVLHFGLGDLVGETTAGAANLNEQVPVGSQFVMSVSHGYPVHPVTGTNWEGVGVPPTVESPSKDALDLAHSTAVRQLVAADRTDELRAEHAWALVAVDARRQPPPPPEPAALASHVGRYDGVEVGLRDGHLWLTRPHRHDYRLTPLTADGLYAAIGNDRLRISFEPGRLLLHSQANPQPQAYRRDN